MFYFCPSCLSELDKDSVRCPYCNCDIKEFSRKKDFVEKLIAALHHPEPSTPIRAATILGHLKDERAVEPLFELARGTDDMYVRVAAIKALVAIKTRRSLELAKMFLQSLSEIEHGLLREEKWEFDGIQEKGRQEND